LSGIQSILPLLFHLSSLAVMTFSLLSVNSDQGKTVRRTLCLLCLAVAGMGSYGNSFGGRFVFDDGGSILENPAVRTLWPPWSPLLNTTRPVANWSFALNYALGGTEVRGYHLGNLLVHLAAALVLFELAWRTLAKTARYARHADSLALAITLLWTVHPLQTQSVTYIVQRMESLMGLFYLLTIYCFVRAQESRRPSWWYIASVICCVLGMGTKEVMVTAPVLVLWYDRTFIASSWREILTGRKKYYLALAATWILPAVFLIGYAPAYRANGALTVQGVPPWAYALSQPGVILYYLRLCFWPQGQCLDYGWPVAHTATEILPVLLVIAALLALTTWCVFRRPAWGFVGGWFFVILMPTSSIAPLRDLAFEHRMYLPLAAVAVVVVLGGYELLKWASDRLALGAWAVPILFLMPLVAAVVLLGYLTHVRNRVYYSEETLWRDIVRQAPHHARALYNLGCVLAAQGKLRDAMSYCRQAVLVGPQDPRAHFNLGVLLEKERRFNEALGCYRRSLRLNPRQPDSHLNAGRLLAPTQPLAAIRHYQAALHLDPRSAEAHNNLARLLTRQKRFGEAAEHLRDALRLRPEYANAHLNLANVLSQQGKLPEALEHLREGLRIKPEYRPMVEADPVLAPLFKLLNSNGRGRHSQSFAVSEEPGGSKGGSR
jgi:tetratricopeptide (TPR) repeat protein